MKKILIAPIALALLTAGSYGVSSFIAKNNFETALAEVQTKVAKPINMTYKQGFLSSTVQLDVEVPIAANNGDVQLTVHTSHTIYHGPFVFQSVLGKKPFYIPVQAYAQGTLYYEISGTPDQTLIDAVKEGSTTTITSTFPFAGNPTVNFSGKPFNKEFMVEGETLAVDWQGFQGQLTMQGSMRDFTYNFNAPALTLSEDGPKELSITGITSSGTAHSGSFDIGLGNYLAGIKNITVTLSEEAGDRVNIQNMQMKVTADEKEGLLTISEFFDIDTLLVNEKSYGPMNTTVHIRNLDSQTISAMNQQYIDLQKQHGQNQETMQAQLMEMISSHGVTLLSKSPEFEFENISLQTSEGAGQVKMKFQFNGEGQVVMNPFFLLGRLSAEASLGADERFIAVLAKDIFKQSMCDNNQDAACDQQAARASSEQLQNLLRSGKLLLEKGRYTANINYKDGAAILNGAPLSLF